MNATHSPSAEPWPTELRLTDKGRVLSITFDNGEAYALDAEYLRVESPSAEVQGHSPDERKWIGGKRNVRITGAEPVGRYAVKLVFDDGHERGIYPWEVLRHLARCHADIWPIYLSQLEARGLTREP